MSFLTLSFNIDSCLVIPLGFNIVALQTRQQSAFQLSVEMLVPDQWIINGNFVIISLWTGINYSSNLSGFNSETFHIPARYVQHDWSNGDCQVFNLASATEQHVPFVDNWGHEMLKWYKTADVIIMFARYRIFPPFCKHLMQKRCQLPACFHHLRH